MKFCIVDPRTDDTITAYDNEDQAEAAVSEFNYLTAECDQVDLVALTEEEYKNYLKEEIVMENLTNTRKFIKPNGQTVIFTASESGEVLVRTLIAGEELEWDVIWGCQAYKYIKKLKEEGALDVGGEYSGIENSDCSKCRCSECLYSQSKKEIPIA